ncbi:sugar transferase [Galbibacter sp. EGI 63066]|uniref:sugar transferase n=1 Tax=Galbibacter sp. EGI 63066 TaxID=2993559 RepID=UPI0022490A59|nr:sugar transferase [Galbibacter sp. EGI 63066]MCX2679177.1 sugar transferase [Galbibacter sp. EGI 63066]
MYSLFLKRGGDFVLALIGIIILLPVILVLSLILIFVNKGTPFFVQLRPGKGEKVFNLIKFKSMNDYKDENGELLPYNQRITKTGRFIRKYSLDEIPQLFNVLKGDMSLIGPRPLLVKYLPLYNDFQKQRHLVKPGITGWAQVNGRNSISWDQKFELDVWYVKNLSFKTDLHILQKTIRKVIVKEGINNNTSLNMPAFEGNN